MSTAVGDQQDGAAARFRARAAERRTRQAERDAGGVRVVDSLDQLQARAERLLGGGAPARAVGRAASKDVLERIIAGDDQRPVAFLARGVRTAETVGRITTRVSLGTGFLVGRRLLLTNNHVLPDAATAAGSFVEFDAELAVSGLPETPVSYVLDPGTLYLTDEEVDATLVAVAPGPDGVRPGDRHGWNRLLTQQGKIVVGEAANVIGHPSGRRKEIAIRHNELIDQLELFLHYEADTEPGSSGSPVFNDDWEVVALHHAGVPRTDDQGRRLTVDGASWSPEMGEAALGWVANEGARISVVLGRLRERELSPGERAVRDELDEPAPVPELAAVVPAARGATRERAALGALATAGTGARPSQARTPHLVFLHGRSQQGRDPAVLRQAWTDGLNRGLGVDRAVDAGSVWFPFYGDLLAARLDRGHSPEEAFVPGLDVAERFAPETASARRRYTELLVEAARRAGWSPRAEGAPAPTGAREGFVDDLVGKLQPALGWLAGRSKLDDAVIALAFRDVALYLDDETVRKDVLDAVSTTLPAEGPVVLVAHSLGSVVAMDLLRDLSPNLDVRVLVTAGSPLGMDTVTDRLLVPGTTRPTRVGRWVNAFSPADAVAIGCPLSRAWGPGVEEFVTDNPGDNPHDIALYLADPRVAGAVVGG